VKIEVTRTSGEVVVVMRESLRDVVRSDQPTWTLVYEQDGMADFNIWTVWIPLEAAGVLLRGLQEAGVK
jgi:hypothetical protein